MITHTFFNHVFSVILIKVHYVQHFINGIFMDFFFQNNKNTKKCFIEFLKKYIWKNIIRNSQTIEKCLKSICSLDNCHQLMLDLSKDDG
jgi:hypothetical protein